MSKTTLRKRISLVAVTALTAGVLSVVVAPAANANINAQNTIMIGAGEGLKVATGTNTSGATVTSATTDARSLGLLYKDPSTTTAQTATVLAGGALVLIGHETAATSQAFSATGGTFSTPVGGGGTMTATSVEYGAGNASVMLSSTNATAVAVRWAAPTTAGTYTLSLSVSTATTQFTTLATRGDGTVRGNVIVTVVAASSGGSYSAGNSACYLATSGTAVGSDTTTAFQNGTSAYIQLNLNDAYGTDLDNGNIVATATNGGLISIGTGSQSVGTASTVVAYDNGASAGDTYGTVRLSQPTAGAPLTSTVTITYNGTTVCTKTVTISGAADSMTIGFVGSGDLGTGTANAYWLINETGVSTGRTAGHYLVALKDSAGNIVNPASNDSFSMDSATATTTVTALTVNIADRATSTAYSASDYWSWTPGTFTCGPVAGSSKVKLKHTAGATGKIVTGEFTARCADRPATYTASFDKASYVQGEIATLTVKFFDSKGNPANSTDAIGALTETVSMMTRVTSVGDANTRAKADGTRSYTYTVGTTTGLTAGSYNGLISFADLTALGGTTQTVTYKVSTGADTTTNADVLKSIVALIASINKQIQALQKLILKR